MSKERPGIIPFASVDEAYETGYREGSDSTFDDSREQLDVYAWLLAEARWYAGQNRVDYLPWETREPGRDRAR